MTPPRLFIAATRQDDGKTTASLGLLMHALQQTPCVGFMKPVGQRYVQLDDGTKVDKDVWLIRSCFPLHDAPALMSPVTVPREFTRAYIDHRDPDTLAQQVRTAFVRVAQDKKFVLLEGTGHAGVGAVFDLSNARVAQLLESPVLLVAGGGIGKPVDEILLNVALFRAHDVPIAGVLLNKVAPGKLDEVSDYARRALAWHGIRVVGVVPYMPLLSQPTVREIAALIEGVFLSGDECAARLIAEVVLITHYSAEVARRIAPQTLLVTNGEQSDLLVACASEDAHNQSLRSNVAGIVLTDGVEPKPHIIKMLRQAQVPVVLSDMPAFQATSRISTMAAKIQPDNPEKRAMIAALFQRHVDMAALGLPV
jgi:BioD-like phosphotransacetylase family protein